MDLFISIHIFSLAWAKVFSITVFSPIVAIVGLVSAIYVFMPDDKHASLISLPVMNSLLPVTF
jgi:hypothetical protein